jgi:ABC-2 type transport system permease protein
VQKYLTVFLLSLQNEFNYRLNFILWRLRNILRILMTYFLWQGIFYSRPVIAGFSRTQMLTYVFLVLFVQSVVIFAPSTDAVSSEISSGDLSNFLVRPLGYLRYWFTRDIAVKLLSLIFSVFEIFILWLLLRPSITLPSDPFTFIGFIISLILGIFIYFLLEISVGFVSFWTPEQTWGLTFLTLVFIETLSGAIFPVNLLPDVIKNVVNLTPFPYLIYYPISIFVGTSTGITIIKIIIIMLVWVLLLFKLNRWLWTRGLKTYSADGR